MRDTDYRAWYAGSYCKILEINFAGEVVTLYSKEEHSTETVRIDDVVFEQFTGLHDKNVKPIYEGDLLDIGIDDFVEVSYSETLSSFIVSGGWLSGDDLCSYAENATVTGTVHQNHEPIEASHA